MSSIVSQPLAGDENYLDSLRGNEGYVFQIHGKREDFVKFAIRVAPGPEVGRFAVIIEERTSSSGCLCFKNITCCGPGVNQLQGAIACLKGQFCRAFSPLCCLICAETKQTTSKTFHAATIANIATEDVTIRCCLPCCRASCCKSCNTGDGFLIIETVDGKTYSQDILSGAEGGGKCTWSDEKLKFLEDPKSVIGTVRNVLMFLAAQARKAEKVLVRQGT